MTAPTTTSPPRPAPTRRRRRARTARAQRRLAWLLVAPAVLVMLAVTVLPLGYAGWLSLQRYDLRFPDRHRLVGFGNYGSVLSSPVFWGDLGATAVITVVAVTAEMILGTAVAVVLHRAMVGRRLVHTAVLLPYAAITVVAAFAWQYAFTPELSFFSDRAWLSERWSSFAVVIATEVWRTTPLVALLLLAALAAVPEELLETARVDGATAWQRFSRVLLPAVRPVLLVVLLYRTLDSVRVFDTVFVQTGGANGTETLSLLAYDQLVDRLNLGLGSTVSVLLFALAAGIALGFLLAFRSELRQLSGGAGQRHEPGGEEWDL
jgi:multiple sugar transport system permease protein